MVSKFFFFLFGYKAVWFIGANKIVYLFYLVYCMYYFLIKGLKCLKYFDYNELVMRIIIFF